MILDAGFEMTELIVKQFFFQDEVEILTFFDGDDDEDEYSCNSVNFQARSFKF